MRVALVTFIQGDQSGSRSILSKLENGSASRGNQVEVFDGFKDLLNTRLTIFDYIAVLYKPSGFFGGKLPSRIAEFLATSGTVAGKKGCALVLKHGFSGAKQCRSLMKILEAEGLMLDYFDIVRDEEHASAVGKKIG